MNYDYQNSQLGYDQPDYLTQTPVASKTFMANVFIWMFVALGISAITAFFCSVNMSALIEFVRSGGKLFSYAIMFAPLAFVLTMSFGYQRLSMPVLALLFIAYSMVNGVTFSFILLRYTSTSVISCFAAASAMFALMAVMGYTTKQDLTSFGRLMMMGLFGIVIASVINWFLGSGAMDYIIGIIGVAVFTGLTAYDVQKLKNIGNGIDAQGNTMGLVDTKKYAIIGALNLYLDFINLFLMLLRVFGGRKN
jgi:uncharacterized protein